MTHGASLHAACPPPPRYRVTDHGLTWHAGPVAEPSRTEVEACREWIASRATPRKTINRRMSSYGWKHLAEDDSGQYVSNGSFIRAALDLGYRLQPCADGRSPNCWLNITVKGNAP